MVPALLFPTTLTFQRHLSPLLLLLTIGSVSAGVRSKTLAEWCRSDILIGDPLGIPAENRYDETTHTCTQTFGIFDKSRANVICQKKAPFPISKVEYNSESGVTCTWESVVSCPNENSITFYGTCLEIAKEGECKQPFIVNSATNANFLTVLLRNRGVKALQIRLVNTKSNQDMVVKQYGFGKNGFVKNGPESWRPALVLVSEPMLKIPAGSLVRTNFEGLNTKVLCDQRKSAGDSEVVSIKTRNRYQPAILNDMHEVDVSEFHKICAALCNGCYASTKYKQTDDGKAFYIPVHRKHDKKQEDFENCKIKSDSRQLRQYYMANFGGNEVMADGAKWKEDHPKAECADGPRSAAMEMGNSAFVDVPPFGRACIVCTNEIRTDKEGVAECIANSNLVDGACQCKKGFIDIHDISGFEQEKAMYDKGMFCVSENCRKNSENFGTGCKCKAGFTDIHDITDAFVKERHDYKRGEYCVQKLSCGKNTVPDYSMQTCVCITGYIPRKEDEVEATRTAEEEYCILRRKCEQNSDYQKGKNTCTCRKGFVNIVDIEDPRSVDYKNEDGFCVTKVKCEGNSKEDQFNGKPTNKCVCKPGFADIEDTYTDDSNKGQYQPGENCIAVTTTQVPVTTTGPPCVETLKPMHFVLVVDSSASINTCSTPCENWEDNVKPFVAKVGEYLNPEYTTITVIIYSTDVIVRPRISPGWTREAFKSKIMKEAHLSDMTLTKEAIQEAFKTLAMDKENQIKAIVLISDGEPKILTYQDIKDTSNTYAYSTLVEIDSLKKQHKDVHLITVGIGPFLQKGVNVTKNEQDAGTLMKGHEILKQLASGEDGAKKYVNAGDDFENLSGEILKSAINKRCI